VFARIVEKTAGTMVTTGRQSHAVVLLGAASLALAGCIATIRQERIDGPARPAVDARSVVVTEHRAVPEPASGGHDHDADADAAPAEVGECRELQVTGPMVRDIDLRRSFADDAQEKNAVLTMLIGAGIAFLAYGASVVHCPQCFDVGPLETGQYAVLGIAALPLAFLTYNAVRVRDRRETEPAAPEERSGPWHACADEGAR
jgi:hypothetical protein